MLAEVEKGNIGTIIVKDMSRLGRNYVQMGMLREQLRRANVRLIAVNEGVDTGSGFDDDFLPFRDVINEYYAKDISKKIKSTFKAKGESGKHVASSPPYGYLKDSGDKNQWVIDEEAAPIVRRIFRMTLEGYGPYQIDQWLIFEDIHAPIIDQETFDNVQRIRGQVRRYPDGWGEAHPLTGLMYCAGCGGKMYVHRVNNGKRVPMYVCGNYAKQPVGTLCQSAHRIKANHVMEIATKTIREVVKYANFDKERFAEEIQSHIEDRQTVDFTEQKKRMVVCEKRIGELEMLIA